MDVDVNNLPSGLANFLKHRYPRTRTFHVYLGNEVAVRQNSRIDEWAERRIYTPTFLVYMGGVGQAIQLDHTYPERLLRSGEALVYETGKYVRVEMLKEDAAHIQTVKLNFDDPVVRAVLYIYTRINSRGHYRQDAKQRLAARVGHPAIQVAMDALLEQNLLNITKSKAVIATPAGVQAGSMLSDKDNPLYQYNY